MEKGEQNKSKKIRLGETDKRLLAFTQVVKSGAGLAFVSYPEVLAKFDFAPQVRMGKITKPPLIIGVLGWVREEVGEQYLKLLRFESKGVLNILLEKYHSVE